MVGRVAVRVVATHQIEAAFAPYGGAILSTEEVEFFGLHVDHRDNWGRFDFARLALLRYADDVQMAYLVGSPDMNPSELRGLPHLGDFQTINFLVNTFSDNHCRYIGRTRTEDLSLNSPFITEVGIRYLTKNTALKVFSPGNFNLTPEAAAELAGFEELRGLHLGNATTTPEAFAELPASLRLIALTLPRAADDAYIDPIARWQWMKTLRLIDTEMTAEGLDRMLQLLPRDSTVFFEFTTVDRMSNAQEKIATLTKRAEEQKITIGIDPPD